MRIPMMMRRDESVEKESDEIQIIDPHIDPTPQKIQKEIDYRPALKCIFHNLFELPYFHH